ncbi:class A beta-lactamase-related serine hydrolase, partial [bacterium]
MLNRRSLLKASLLIPALPKILESQVWAQPTVAANSQWLQAIAKQIQQEFNLPGFWVAVNVDGRIDAAVVGVRKLGDPTPAEIDEPFDVASVSKPMVAFWIASLVDEGKLSYDSKVLDILPELAEGCLPEHRQITLGQLLSHRAEVVMNSRNDRQGLKVAEYPAERIRQAKDILSQPSPPESIGKDFYSNNG